MKDFGMFPEVVKAIQKHQQNSSCFMELPYENGYTTKLSTDFYETIGILFNIEKDFDIFEVNNGEVSWAFAAAELIRRTRSRIPGSKLIPVNKITAVLLFLFQRPELVSKRNPQEICPLFRIRCPKIQEIISGECPHYAPICLYYKFMGNTYWVKRTTVIEQAKNALDKERVLYGVFETRDNNEWGDHAEYAAVLTGHFELMKGKTEVFFHNFRERKGKSMSGYIDIRSMKKIYDGYFMEKEMTGEEKKAKAKSKYEYSYEYLW